MGETTFFYHLGGFQAAEIFFSRNRFAKVYYFNISKPAILFLVIFGLNKTVRPYHFILEKIRDERGESYWPKIFSEQMPPLCDQLTNEVVRGDRFLCSVSELFDRENLFLYFKRCIQEEVEDIVIFCNVIRWHASKFGMEHLRDITFVIPSSPYVEVIRDYAFKKFGIHVTHRFGSWKVFGLVRALGKNIGKMFFVIFTPLSFNNIRSFLLKGRVSSMGKPRVGISYSGFGSITFDKTKRCEFPWLFDVNVPYRQVCLYFRRHDVPISEEELRLLSEKEIHCTSFSYNKGLLQRVGAHTSTFYGTKTVLRLSAKTFYFLLRECLRFNWSSIRYLHRVVAFIVHYSRAIDFYRTNNIKVNVDYDVSAVTRIIEQQALSDIGGVSVNFQLSNWPYSETSLASCADIQMIFGPHYQKILERSGARSKHFVCHGYANDYAFATVKEKAKQLRRTLWRAGAQFIVSYFDENTSNERMSTLSHATSAYVYKRLFHWVIADEAIGLICSPKKPKNLFQRIPEIQDLAERAKATGRCIFRESIYSTIAYPTESAQASDIAIAQLAGGTVAMESFLSRVRTVYLDLEGLYSFPEYQSGKGKIVFDDLDELIHTINEGRRNEELLNTLGNKNMAPDLERKDPFQDGKAAMRMGQYIRWLLEKMEDCVEREDVINYANAQYKKAWGNEHVIQKGNDGDFFENHYGGKS